MKSGFRVEGLRKSYGTNTIVDDLELPIEAGEFIVLLGPSGCGKTTTLRCLAGLETPEAGRISFGDRTVFDSAARVAVPAHKRNIGMVFQSYALWPNKTVRQNIAYPLTVRRMSGALRGGAVERAAEMVDCANLLDRYPGQLSGGQQQRVAVARGLVAEPDLVLFDEPLSNLDARLRDQVRTQIHQLHQDLRFTAVFVTHDQSEALALADRLAVMRAGRLEQFDTPQRVYEEPATEYVAAFMGMSNRLELTRRPEGWATESGDVVDLGDHPSPAGERAVVRLRPEDLRLHRAADDVPAGHRGLSGVLVTSEYAGRTYDVLVEVDGRRLQARADGRDSGDWLRASGPGTPVTVSFAPAHLRVFSGTTADPADVSTVPIGAGV
ncbi:ABC transporter ATP-binding protein [Cryptosporangium sp. NPDC051539]|uniref:ABC transporter ATP-binding protein n=1 Tax=Cryptosporangium sp. NPDC051539 TaxID=3363962 RepID=UPI0037B680E6